LFIEIEGTTSWAGILGFNQNKESKSTKSLGAVVGKKPIRCYKQ
jgi:hypothetical protein